jgi:hypothetical protein
MKNSTNGTLPNLMKFYSLSLKAKSDDDGNKFDIDPNDFRHQNVHPVIDSIPLVIMGICLLYNVRYEGS